MKHHKILIHLFSTIVLFSALFILMPQLVFAHNANDTVRLNNGVSQNISLNELSSSIYSENRKIYAEFTLPEECVIQVKVHNNGINGLKWGGSGSFSSEMFTEMTGENLTDSTWTGTAKQGTQKICLYELSTMKYVDGVQKYINYGFNVTVTVSFFPDSKYKNASKINIPLGQPEHITMSGRYVSTGKRSVDAIFTTEYYGKVTITATTAAGFPLTWWANENSEDVYHYGLQEDEGAFKFTGDKVGYNMPQTTVTWSGEIYEGTHTIHFSEACSETSNFYHFYEAKGLDFILTIIFERKESPEEAFEREYNSKSFDKVGKDYYTINTGSKPFFPKYKLTNMDNPRITWKSGNKNILNLSNTSPKKGFEGFNLGVTTLTATVEDDIEDDVFSMTQKWTVIVNKALHTGKGYGLDTEVGSTESFKSEVKYIDNYKKIKWKSSNNKICTVNKKKLTLTAKKTGKCYIVGESMGVIYKLQVDVVKKSSQPKEQVKDKKVTLTNRQKTELLVAAGSRMLELFGTSSRCFYKTYTSDGKLIYYLSSRTGYHQLQAYYNSSTRITVKKIY